MLVQSAIATLDRVGSSSGAVALGARAPLTDQLRIVTTDLSSTTQDLSARRATLLLAGLYAASVLVRLVGTFLLAVPNIFGDELWHIEFARSVLDWRGLYWGTAHANHPSWLYPLLLAPACGGRPPVPD